MIHAEKQRTKHHHPLFFICYYALPEAFLEAGRVRIFDFSAGEGWTQVGNDIAGEAKFASLGTTVHFSKNGDTVAIGGLRINNGSGHVRIFELVEDKSGIRTWEQVGQTLYGPADTGGGSTPSIYRFGTSVALNDDATLLAVGTPGDFSTASTIAGSISVFQVTSPPTLAPISNDPLPNPPNVTSPPSSSSCAGVQFLAGIARTMGDMVITPFERLFAAFP